MAWRPPSECLTVSTALSGDMLTLLARARGEWLLNFAGNRLQDGAAARDDADFAVS